MSVFSHFRGHEIAYINDVWVYVDTGEPVASVPDRSCGYCGRKRTKEGYDGCIGFIVGAQNACCGHGNTEEAYIQYEDGSEVRGINARNKQRVMILKRSKLNEKT